MEQKFTLVCAWTQDESKNDKCFTNESHWSLYQADPANCVGQRYLKTLDLGCGGRWISDEAAQKLIDKHGDLR